MGWSENQFGSSNSYVRKPKTVSNMPSFGLGENVAAKGDLVARSSACSLMNIPGALLPHQTVVSQFQLAPCVLCAPVVSNR